MDPPAPFTGVELAPIKLGGIEGALDEAVYMHGLQPFVCDPTGQARRWLQYQRGQLFTITAAVTVPSGEKLREALVRCLAAGGSLVLSFSNGCGVELEALFSDLFPATVLDGDLMSADFWGPLLRPAVGDPPAELFVPLSSFKFVVVSTDEGMACRASMATVRVLDSVSQSNREKLGAEGDVSAFAVSEALGVKEVKRNCTELVEAALENKQAEVQEWLDKGYYADSADVHGVSALSEACCRGHLDLANMLLDEGCDPNSSSDQGRTPLFRAAFQGHLAVCECLLEAGADPRLRAADETPWHVASTEEIKSLLSSWDLTKTDLLKEMRKQEMTKKMDARLQTAAEREAYAREQFAKELVELSEAGDVEPLTALLNKLTGEAITNRERPRGKAETRDARGNTLLMIAAAKGYVDIATKLLTCYRDLDEDFDPEARLVWYVNVNAKEKKGWNSTQLATFHGHKTMLQLLLAHGGDPVTKNSYGKSAVDFAKDTLDACQRTTEDRSELRNVIIAWDDERRARKLATAATAVPDPAAGDETPAPPGGCTLFDAPPADAAEEVKDHSQAAEVGTEVATVEIGTKKGAKAGGGAKKGGKAKGTKKGGKAKSKPATTRGKTSSPAAAAGNGARAARALSPRGAAAT